LIKLRLYAMRIIQFDGGAIPNPGDMGIGVVLLENSNIITTISKKLPDKGTNNTAEYTALLTGILKALELGWKEVSIEGDSELVINQVNGSWNIKKEHLENLYNQVVKELSNFDSYTINWIPRENNSIADKLASNALGYEEDPHGAIKNYYNSYNQNKDNVDIKCPKCKRDCEFKWQEFKNGTCHIRQECPIHGYIRYAPKIEPYTIIANQGKENTFQKKLF
jgi:ribonuclease HI